MCVRFDLTRRSIGHKLIFVIIFTGGEERFDVNRETGIIRTRGSQPFRLGKEYEIGVSAEDVSARTLQRSPTQSLKILVGERDPQFYETQYTATVPENEPEGYKFVIACLLCTSVDVCIVKLFLCRSKSN